MEMIIVDCPMGMHVQVAWMAFECPLRMHSTNVIENIYVFSVANDLLDENGCLVLLQNFDDASTMELFSFTWGSKVYIMAKEYTCINNIPMHIKLGKVIPRLPPN
jgi:hypothetical protein